MMSTSAGEPRGSRSGQVVVVVVSGAHDSHSGGRIYASNEHTYHETGVKLNKDDKNMLANVLSSRLCR